MADHSKPTTTDTYTNWPTYLDGRFDDLAMGLEAAATSPTNLPSGSIRWNAAGKKWQIYSGSPLAWSDLSADYTINITGLLSTDTVTFAAARLTNTGDASLASTTHAFQIGATGSANLIADANEIMARNNGAAANLSLNFDGGDVYACTDGARFYSGGMTNLGKSTKAISGGAITVTTSYTLVTGEGATTDNLDSINGGVEGDILYLRHGSTGYTITVRDVTGSGGNIELAGGSSFGLTNARDMLKLLYNGSLDRKSVV